MTREIEIPGEAPAGIRFRLLENEKILWQGRPALGLIYTAHEMFAAPVGVAICAMALYQAANALLGKFDPEDLGLAILMFFAGLVVIGGVPLVKALLRRKIFYYVTTQRVVVVNVSAFPRFYSAKLQDLPPIELTGDERRGTLYFGASDPAPPQSGIDRSLQYSPTAKFFEIENPRKILDLIKRTAASQVAEPV